MMRAKHFVTSTSKLLRDCVLQRGYQITVGHMLGKAWLF